MPKSKYRKMRSKPARSDGNPRKVTTSKYSGANVRSGRMYGKGGSMSRKHN